MITINLVPDEHKQRADKKKIFISIKEALLIILLFASVASILLILSKFYLEDKLTDLTDQNSRGIAAIQVTNNKIKSLNNKINDFYTVQKNFKKWSVVVSKINEAKGAGIIYNNVKIFKQQSTVEISGISKTRNDLLALEKRLQAIPYFTDIDLPLSDLISKENNSFNIIIQLDLNKIQ